MNTKSTDKLDEKELQCIQFIIALQTRTAKKHFCAVIDYPYINFQKMLLFCKKAAESCKSIRFYQAH